MLRELFTYHDAKASTSTSIFIATANYNDSYYEYLTN